ncbi:sugar nucleotide-binding protein [Heliobacterium undosum]|uniref:Sugar nucleotide-binding protein n=1 Tax=Heliomicrobium undosum TaxID=121734 RepID=A0A845L6T2_9FIRM|nr:SDR family oxidoreductase [Heliomicrobium undosum]MZP29448.1 sugar nucleotide-binding protein [Heliomicrobium undosum]
MKKILLTGFSGYVGGIIGRFLEGTAELHTLSARCAPGERTWRCDLADREQVEAVASALSPDLIIHAAGLKDIALCEREPALAHAANAQSTLNLLEAFPRASRVIYISTDYVFDGHQGNYSETSPTYPATVYGQSKLAAEKIGMNSSDRFYVLRLAALYDSRSTFIRFLRGALSRGQSVDCYSDVCYGPTYYKDFLAMLHGMITRERLERRIYHVVGEPVSRYGFARAYAEIARFDPGLVRPSKRPADGCFLFPEMWLTDTLSRRELDVPRLSHSEALRQIHEEEISASV